MEFYLVLVLAGTAWGARAIILSGFPSSETSQPPSDITYKCGRMTLDDREERTRKSDAPESSVETGKVFTERLHPPKDFGLSEMLEYLLRPFQPVFRDETEKKPKLKTVVSLSEVIGPKHRVIQPFHVEPLVSPFGVKEIGLADDPFFDVTKMLSFVPKFGKIDFVWPTKRRRTDDFNNLTDQDFPGALPVHRHIKKDTSMIDIDMENPDDKCQPSLFIKTNCDESPLSSLGQIKLDGGK